MDTKDSSGGLFVKREVRVCRYWTPDGHLPPLAKVVVVVKFFLYQHPPEELKFSFISFLFFWEKSNKFVGEFGFTPR